MTDASSPEAHGTTESTKAGPSEYFREAASWAADRRAAGDRSRTIAWIVAGVAVAVALLEAIALAALTPLKREVPYTLLVDRQTGHVEALKPLDQTVIAPDAALTRSFLVQYVIARESFDRSTLPEDYRKVALLSAGEARERYIKSVSAGNPLSPLASLPANATVDVTIRSVSSLTSTRSLVRFSTTRTDPSGRSQLAQNWAAVISYRYVTAEMSAEDRLVNPLGFQVTRYRKDPETLPDAQPLVSVVAPAMDTPRP